MLCAPRRRRLLQVTRFLRIVGGCPDGQFECEGQCSEVACDVRSLIVPDAAAPGRNTRPRLTLLIPASSPNADAAFEQPASGSGAAAQAASFNRSFIVTYGVPSGLQLAPCVSQQAGGGGGCAATAADAEEGDLSRDITFTVRDADPRFEVPPPV